MISTYERFLAAVLLTMVVSCTRPRTEVVVVLSTDYAWGPEQPLRAVQVQVRSASPTGPLRDLHVYPLGAAGRYAMPASFGITPLSDEHGTLWIEASGCADLECAVVLTRQRALTAFAAGETVVLPMFLARACESVTCDNPLQTCRPSDRSCAPAQVDVTTLARFGSDAGAGPNVDASFPDLIDAGAGPNVDASFPDETAACLSGQEMCGGACRDLQSDGDHCGACGHACAAEEHCSAAVCGPTTPRLIAPLSTATVTSRRPTLHWALARGTDGAAVEICRDRACATVVTTFTAEGDHGAPAMELPTGVLFWRARGRVAGTTMAGRSPTWQFTVGVRTAPVDTSWGTTADFNGDGYGDVVVSAFTALSRIGRAYVYPGRAGGPAATPGQTLTGPDSSGGLFGNTIASAGDVNGDGYADLVVGAFAAMNRVGQAYLYLGGASGLAATPTQTLTGPDGPNSFFGVHVASAGDINGDGYADLVFGNDEAMSAIGRAHIYLGGASGLVAAPTQTLIGPEPGSYFGASVAGAGDVNGDGYADLVVGAPGVMNSIGQAYLYLGSAGGLAATPTRTITNPFGLVGSYGRSVAGAGDVNGDGYADVVVGDQSAARNLGRAYVYLGAADGLSASPAQTITGLDGAYTNFGQPVTSAGDVNGDGYADVATAAIMAIGGTGRVHVYLGSASGTTSAPAASFTGPDGAIGYFGLSIASAGDVDGDGYADMVVGAPRVMSSAGRAYLYLGSASGLAATPTLTLTGPDGGNFGQSVTSVRASENVDDTDTLLGNRATGANTGWAYLRLGTMGRTDTSWPGLVGGGLGRFGWPIAHDEDLGARDHGRRRGRVLGGWHRGYGDGRS